MFMSYSKMESISRLIKMVMFIGFKKIKAAPHTLHEDDYSINRIDCEDLWDGKEQ